MEGTEKALHTIKNYRSDLKSFERFLLEGLGSQPVPIHRLNARDLEKYGDFLKQNGFKTNTRRRKILTARKLMRYLSRRNKIKGDWGGKMPAPAKVERVPEAHPYIELIEKIRALPSATLLDRRNRALLWLMAESGCLVSEAASLRFEQLDGHAIQFLGKAERAYKASPELIAELQSLKGKTAWIFSGHNKFGPLGGAITPRGVELLVKSYAARVGFPRLTPRAFRHAVIVHWHREGVDKGEIQKRLGLRTQYAFRIYAPLFSATRRSPSG